MAAEITIRIDTDGNAHVEVNGVEGPSCEGITDQLIRALGEVDERVEKEEYVQELPDMIDTYEAD